MLLILACVFVFNPFRTASAEQTDIPPAEETQPAAEPQQLLLIDGDPQATSAQQLRRDNAILTWTPTGHDQDQDFYDIRVGTSSETDELTGELTAAPWFANGLPDAQYDMKAHPAGTYYWQVRSCGELGVCDSWSPVWTMNLDDTPPPIPTLERTTGEYDKVVAFTGTAEAGASVNLTVGDKACTAAVAQDGSWNCTFDGEFDYGDYSLTARASDAAGNASTEVIMEFSVIELFVAPQIAPEELPPVLDIVPADTTPENKVYRQPTVSVIDVVNTGTSQPDETAVAAPKVLSTDGGIVQSSENGWQVLGLPWFLWLGSLGGIAASWWAFGMPVPRRLGSVFSL